MTARVAALAAALLLLVACGEPAPAPSPTPSPEPTSAEGTPGDPIPDPGATPDPDGAPDGEPTPEGGAEPVEPVAGEPSTEEREAEGEPGLLAVTDVRVATHDGFDRVVLDIGGQGVPGWHIRYVDEARTAGRGQLLEIEGDGVLSIAVRNVALPPDLPEDVEPFLGDRVEGPAGGVVTEVAPGVIFEGIHTFFVGVAPGELPFVVERLESPTRVVIDIFHAS